MEKLKFSLHIMMMKMKESKLEQVQVKTEMQVVNLCLLDHTIVMNDIEIEKKLDFLPYVKFKCFWS